MIRVTQLLSRNSSALVFATIRFTNKDSAASNDSHVKPSEGTAAATTESGATQAKTKVPPSELKYPFPYPPLVEKELHEQFKSGSGPGGQKINKKQNCVIIQHIPTGIVVKCQDGRDLTKNRQIARKRLQERLDEHYNGDAAWVKQQSIVEANAVRIAHERAKKKLAKKLAFKEREGLP